MLTDISFSELQMMKRMTMIGDFGVVILDGTRMPMKRMTTTMRMIAICSRCDGREKGDEGGPGFFASAYDGKGIHRWTE